MEFLHFSCIEGLLTVQIQVDIFFSRNVGAGQKHKTGPGRIRKCDVLSELKEGAVEGHERKARGLDLSRSKVCRPGEIPESSVRTQRDRHRVEIILRGIKLLLTANTHDCFLSDLTILF